MPNWCANIIKISGTKSNLDVLKSKLTEQKDEKVNFMEYLIGLVDIPDNYQKDAWRLHNLYRFGTKWDFPFSDSDLELAIKEDSISIFNLTANSPIIPFLSKLCKKYKVEAIIDYFEPGNNFGGRAEIDSSGVECDKECGYLEAMFLYNNKRFWAEVERYIENEFFDDF